MAGLIDRRTKGQHATGHGGGARTRMPGDLQNPGVRMMLNAIENEVIPRLLLTHTASSSTQRTPTATDVERLCAHVLEGNGPASLAMIDTLLEAGCGIEGIYIDLLGGTAKLLGEMWEQDRIGFMDVTVGLCSLHQILFRLGTDDTNPSEAVAGHALFVPIPGETHVFGALIVAKFFARAGWRTWTELSTTEEDLCALIGENEFDLVGLSISVDRDLDRLPGVIERIRAVRPGNGPRIFVGGSAIDRNKGVAVRVGADGTAPDPAGAINLADRLLRQRD